MKQYTRRLIQTFVLAVALGNPIWAVESSAQESGQEPLAPLTKLELIDLFQVSVFRANPEMILNEFIRKNQIAFLPTKHVIEELKKKRVPEMITNELKFNFASRIVYRVCQFEPVDGAGAEFTTRLNTSLERTKFEGVRGDSGHLLFAKSFDPVPAGPTGPTLEELENHPHVGYVLIMGRVDDDLQFPGKRMVTARLVFVSKVQNRMSLGPPLTKQLDNSLESMKRVADQIAEWSIKAVEMQIR